MNEVTRAMDFAKELDERIAKETTEHIHAIVILVNLDENTVATGTALDENTAANSLISTFASYPVHDDN